MTPVRADDRGAIMVMALLFAVFALSLVYAVLGIAAAVQFRERMQDAADATALSGAIAEARTMNFLVLLNIVMAALLAILVTIKLLEGLAIVGMAVASAIAWFTAGASLVAIPPLNGIKTQMESLYDATRPPVYTALEALHTVADTVTDIGPLAAAAVAEDHVVSVESAPVKSGVAVPATAALPVTDDTFPELCGKAGAMPIGIAMDVLEPLGLDAVLGPLKGAMSDLTSSLSAWFCGNGVPAPSYQYSTDPVYPKMGTGCDPVPQNASNSTPAPTTAACDESQTVEQQSEPDPATGNCKPTTDCSLTGPYEQRIEAARVDCNPTSSPAPADYWYQERAGVVTYTRTTAGWVRGTPQYETPSERESAAPPCGPASMHPSVATTYNTVVRRTDDVDDVLPVCSDERVPSTDSVRGSSEMEVRFTEVSQILACQKHEVATVNVAVGSKNGSPGGGKSDDASRVPKKVDKDVSLGDEEFQVRALAHGDVSVLDPADVVARLSSWGHLGQDGTRSEARDLGGNAIAQAEYFYDGSDGRDAWMWNMKWRARLVRFQLPIGAGTDALTKACSSVVGKDVCRDLIADVSSVADVSVH